MKHKSIYKKRSFWQGFLRGLSSSSEIFRSRMCVAETGSPAESMRQDWEAVGDDLRAAMARGYGDTSSDNG